MLYTLAATRLLDPDQDALRLRGAPHYHVLALAFSGTLVKRETAGALSLIGNIIWVVLLGWELALSHLLTAICQCITTIGIPFGLANFTLIPVSLWPLGRKNVSVDEAVQTRGSQPPTSVSHATRA